MSDRGLGLGFDLVALRRRFEIVAARVRRERAFGHVDADHADAAVRVAEEAVQELERRERESVQRENGNPRYITELHPLQSEPESESELESGRRLVHVARGTPAQVREELGRLAKEEEEPS